jgi:hypothetical protein
MTSPDIEQFSLLSDLTVVARHAITSTKYELLDDLAQTHAPEMLVALDRSEPPDERIFNNGEDPDVIAVMKLLPSPRTVNVLWKSRKDSHVYVMRSLDNTIQVAGDVQWGFYHADSGEFRMYNKPAEDASKDDVFKTLCHIFANGQDVIYGTVYNGHAVRDAATLRGMAGVCTSEVTFSAIPKEELALYVFGMKEAIKLGYDVEPIYQRIMSERSYLGKHELKNLEKRLTKGATLKELSQSNAGIKVEGIIFSDHVLSVFGVNRNSHRFDGYFNMFMHRVKGVPEELFDLIKQVKQYALGHDLGDMTDTVRAAAAKYDIFKGMPIGRWQSWRPQPVVVSPTINDPLCVDSRERGDLEQREELMLTLPLLTDMQEYHI